VKKQAKKSAPKKSRIVIVRTYSAGVHVGRLVSLKGTEVVLGDARRVWRWRGANTLHELSQRGADESWTRISEPVPTITLTQGVEVIECSDVGAKNLQRSRWPQ